MNNYLCNLLRFNKNNSSTSKKFEFIKHKISNIYSFENFICKPDMLLSSLPSQEKVQQNNDSNKNKDSNNNNKVCNMKPREVKIHVFGNANINKQINYQVLSRNENYKNAILNFLKSLDLFPQSPKLLIKNRLYFKTKLGSLLTMLLFIISGCLFYFFGQDFFYRINPVISYNQYKLSEMNYPLNNFTDNISLMIGLTNKINRASKFVFYTIENNSYFVDANLTECNDNQIKSFNVTVKKPNFNYLCVDYKDLIIRANTTSAIYLYLAKCTELSEYNINDAFCKIYPEIEFGERLQFEFYRRSKTISQDTSYNVENIIDSYINEKTYDLDLNNYQIFTVYDNIKFNKLSIDKDSLIQNPITKYFITSLPLNNLNSVPLESGKKIRFCNFVIQINQSLLETQIVYQKFDQMLARVMSMITIIVLIMKFINNYFSGYFFIEYMKQDFIKYLAAGKFDKIINTNYPQNISSSTLGLKGINEKEKPTFNWNNILNLKNFLKHSLYFCSEEMDIYKLIYNEFKYSVSAESFIKYSAAIEADSYLNSSLTKKLPMFKNKSEKFSFLTRMDFLSSYNNFFYIDSQKKLKSACGGIIFIVYICFAIFVIFYFGYNFWSSSIIGVETNQLAIYEISNKTNDIDIGFAFAYSKDLYKYTYLYWTNSSFMILPENLITKQCSVEEFYKFFPDNMFKDDKMVYICGNLKDMYPSPYEFYLDKRIYFYINKCDSKSFAGVCQGKWTNSSKTQNFFLEFIYETDYVNLTDYSITKKMFRNSQTGNFLNLLSVDLSLERYLIKDKKMKFFYNQPVKQIIAAENPIISKYEGFQLKLNFPNHTQTLKSLIYEDVTEMLARVLAMLGIVKFFFSQLHLYVFNFFHYKNLLRILLRSSESEVIKYYFLYDNDDNNNNFYSINKTPNIDASLPVNLFANFHINKKSLNLNNYKYPKNISQSIKNNTNINNNNIINDSDSDFVHYIEHEIFTFKNYFLSKLFIPSKNVKLIKKLLKQLEGYLSIENLFRKKLETLS